VLLRAVAAVAVLAAGLTTGSDTVSIAIVDSDVQVTHPDLSGGVDDPETRLGVGESGEVAAAP
jgi:hypothetical protein